MSMGQWWNNDKQGKTEELGQKPALEAHCP
jgi:hypothetical protein